MKKKVFSIVLASAMAASVLTACGSTSSDSASTATSETEATTEETIVAEDTSASSGEKIKISFWYNHSGDEADVFESAIQVYNESQDVYEVEGLSVTDDQKVIVALSGNDAPDVIERSNQLVRQYAQNGFIESLDSYITNDSFDTSIYSAQALTANKIEDALYGLPFEAYTIQMYYNKTLLAEAGYDAPPTTMEELYEMAVAATKLDDSGNIDVLGYPLFPYASARQELIYGFGGRWWDEDGNPTPESEGNLASLNQNVKYRNQFGGKALDSFVSTANTNRYTEQDMFFQGKQLFRLDGSWLPTMMESFGSDVDWGITLVPGTEANPDLQGTSRYETTSLVIPTQSKEKDGAWDFIKWFTSEEGASIVCLGTGNLPALSALYDSEEFNAVPGFTEFMSALELEKGIQYPENMPYYDEYMNLVNSALDTVYAGSATPEDAMASITEQVKSLQ